MFNNKALFGFLLSVALLAVQATAVYAAPAAQTVTGGTCTVQTVALSADSTTVDVTCMDGSTFSFSVDDAAALGLVTKNADGTVTVNDVVGQTIDTTGASDPCAAPTDTGSGGTSLTGTSSTGETSQNPVGAALAGFFCEKVDGATYDDIMGYHEDGFGFGVIAQALWFATDLDVDPGAILEAKKSGDYEGLLPDGAPIPTNWGQFRKEVLGLSVQDVKHNLGEIMSGKVENVTTSETPSTSSSSDLSPADVHGHGHGGKGHGHGNGHGKP